jgi:hypothetical protein
MFDRPSLGLEFIEGRPSPFTGSETLPAFQPQRRSDSKSFASLFSDSVESSANLNELSSPIIHGDKIHIKINEDLYHEQLKHFRTNLIGRLLLRKGSSPVRSDALKS